MMRWAPLLLRNLLLMCIALVPIAACTRNGGSNGNNPRPNILTQMAAGQGNQWAQEQVASAAAADGMQLFVRLLEQNGHDRQRAWMAFYQTPEGQRVARTPGALKLLTDWLNSVVTLPSGQQDSYPEQDSYPAQKQPLTGPQQSIGANTQPANQLGANGSFLGPYRPNAYGPGINSDATGRPFIWQPSPGQGPPDPFATVRPNAYGPGIGMDQFGRPVQPACPPSQQFC